MVDMRGRRSVILLHDGGYRAMGAEARSQTVIATDNLIQRYQR